LRVFGCNAYAHVDNGKLEPRAFKCIFLGYGLGVQASKLWNPKTKKVLLSRNAIFNGDFYFRALRSLIVLSFPQPLNFSAVFPSL
jgi:hypothetical protein